MKPMDGPDRRNTIQVLYEISLAIGSSSDLQSMLRTALASLLRKLNCAAGGVFANSANGPGLELFTCTYAMPRIPERNAAYALALAEIKAVTSKDARTKFLTSCPRVLRAANGDSAHILVLPSYGVLVLVSAPAPLEDYVILSIRPLLAKLAQASNACEVAGHLWESEERLDLVLRGADLGIWDWDLTTGKVVLNERFPRAYGYDPEDVGEDVQDWIRLFHPDDIQGARQQLHRHLRGETDVYEIEFRLKTKDGSWRWVQCRGAVVQWSPASRAIRATGTNLDISSRKVAEQALEVAKEEAEEATRAKSDFLAMISHEIRTPLAAILGYTEILESSPLAFEQSAEMTHNLRMNAEHLHSLVGNVLDLSKIEAGEIIVHKEPCELLPMLEATLSALHPIAATKHVQLKTVTRGPVPRSIACDPLKTKQILINLVSNAIQHTSHGLVTVAVARSLKVVEERAVLDITVSDTGGGIEQSQLDSIFEPFSQVASQTESGTGHVGLGLTISRGLAQILGGDLSVTSELGEGSHFTLTLDVGLAEETDWHLVEDMEPGSVGKARGSDCAQYGLEGKRVLLVEDGQDNRLIIRHFLSDAGCLVELANDGREGVDAVLRAERTGCPFDLVLMDMQMPVLDGYGATREIRDCGQTLPIVALTAGAMLADRDKCLAVGCDEYLTKPIAPKVLFRVLAECMGIELGTSPPVSPREDLIRNYLLGLTRTAQELRSSHGAGDERQLTRLLHQLRGSGGSYGFPEVTKQADLCRAAFMRGTGQPEAVEKLARFLESIGPGE